MSETLKGRINIARTSSNRDNPVPIRIEITDETSRVRFLDVRLSLEALALALTGMGEVECVFELHGVDKVGMVAESKTEVIKHDAPWGDAKKKLSLKKAIEALEVDGWHARTGDAENHYNYQPDGIHIVFFRHVPHD